MKNPFKSKKEKFPTQPVPRSGDEIKQIYSDLRAKLGENSYRIEILTEDSNQLIKGMKSLNYEMDARQKLDTAAAEEVAAKEASKLQQTAQ